MVHVGNGGICVIFIKSYPLLSFKVEMKLSCLGQFVEFNFCFCVLFQILSLDQYDIEFNMDDGDSQLTSASVYEHPK